MAQKLQGPDSLLNLDLNSGLTTLVDNLEGEVLHVTLNVFVVELATDQTLDVEDGSLGVGCVLVLGWVMVSDCVQSIGRMCAYLRLRQVSPRRSRRRRRE